MYMYPTSKSGSASGPDHKGLLYTTFYMSITLLVTKAPVLYKLLNT